MLKKAMNMLNMLKMSRFLRMHKILVHAQPSCACTTLLCMQRNQAWDPKRARSRAWDRPSCLFGSLAHGSLAQSMHKRVVHAQEIFCVYTKDPRC